ncbi:histidine--tRNA ligase [Phreatobacter cathodiphilus]|uniref:Histidine--tRNA ligase n=1 Tax=Phreatobacter cathodiphilus TaxID=1868589 RepID=A0A2S0NE32_9HYPH|nr:histidine--tRNA ligase [Phreatobacter cathodiphilus]AVO46201.1 histidine--tRNA ligase [Phreatobacter cathodiphilus]
MSDAPKKKAAALARLPRGFVDRDAAEIAGVNAMLDTIRKVYELYGFEAVETPAVEFTDALGKFLPDQDRPNEGVFSFQDDDEQWLSLRYDLTAPLARYVAEHFDALPKPYRSYRAGYVFRNEKPGPGRFRQFMQFDADTVGSASPAADAEICMMAADTMEKLGIARGDYVVRVNNRKVLDGVMEAIGLGGDENAGRRLTVLRAIDKLDKFGPEGVKLLLGAGRKDDSGDFTKGAGLDGRQIEKVLSLFSIRSRSIAIAESNPEYAENVLTEGANFANAAPDAGVLAILASLGRETEIGMQGYEELQQVWELVRQSGYGDGRIILDPSVVRGLEYYTGPVYEVELTFPVTNDDGQVVRFGSVAGGGRYDGLVARFRGEQVPATGFSIGVSRLAAALKSLGKLGAEKPVGPVVVLVMDRDQIAEYQAMVSELRGAGIRAEMYLGSSGMKAQMKYADRRNAPAVIIQGSNEREAGEVMIKDLVAGAEAAKTITDNAEWRASRPAQFAAKRGELVEKIRELLAGR